MSKCLRGSGINPNMKVHIKLPWEPQSLLKCRVPNEPVRSQPGLSTGEDAVPQGEIRSWRGSQGEDDAAPQGARQSQRLAERSRRDSGGTQSSGSLATRQSPSSQDESDSETHTSEPTAETAPGPAVGTSLHTLPPECDPQHYYNWE